MVQPSGSDHAADPDLPETAHGLPWATLLLPPRTVFPPRAAIVFHCYCCSAASNLVSLWRKWVRNTASTYSCLPGMTSGLPFSKRLLWLRLAGLLCSSYKTCDLGSICLPLSFNITLYHYTELLSIPCTTLSFSPLPLQILYQPRCAFPSLLDTVVILPTIEDF